MATHLSALSHLKVDPPGPLCTVVIKRLKFYTLRLVMHVTWTHRLFKESHCQFLEIDGSNPPQTPGGYSPKFLVGTCRPDFQKIGSPELSFSLKTGVSGTKFC